MTQLLSLKILITITFFITVPSLCLAADNQWYIGLGGGASLLSPNPEIAAIDRNNEDGSSSVIFIGRDFEAPSSIQLQFSQLGEVAFNTGDIMEYSSAEAALLYRFVDTRDNKRRGATSGTAFYGRLGLGFLNRDTPIALNNETAVYFGLGAGFETYLTTNWGLRAEAQYLDNDAGTATIALVARFGGSNRQAPRMPPPMPKPVPAPIQQPAVPQAQNNSPVFTTTPDSRINSASSTPGGAIPQASQFPEPSVPSFGRDTVSPTASSQQPDAVLSGGAIDLSDLSSLPEVELMGGETTDTPDNTGSGSFEQTWTQTVPGTQPSSSVSQTTQRTPQQSSQQSTPPSLQQPQVPEWPSRQNSQGQTPQWPSQEATQQTQSPQWPTQQIPQRTTTQTRQIDSDRDQIPNTMDRCPDTPSGLTTDEQGCSLFSGEIEGLRFDTDDTTLIRSATQDLNRLARALVEHPQARVELIAHTDISGSEAEQARRTRGRLRSIGLYLLERGVREDQLILRSFAAERPRASNTTDAGRRMNNRIEIIERSR